MRKVFIVSVLSLFLISSCASLKPHPKPWTPEEIKYGIFFGLAHLADAYTTEQYLNNPQNWEAVNPALGEHPSDGKIVFYFSITGFAALLLSHWYPELRTPFLLGYGSLNAGLAIHNSRLD